MADQPTAMPYRPAEPTGRTVMLEAPRVALIGFGRLGRAFAQAMIGRVGTLSVFDTAFARPDSSPSRAAVAMPVAQFASTRGAVADARIIIAAVPVDMAVEVARSAVEAIECDAYFLDMTGAAGALRVKVRAAIDRAGGRYVAGMVRLVPRAGTLVRTLILKGATAPLLARLLRIAGLNVDCASDERPRPLGGTGPSGMAQILHLPISSRLPEIRLVVVPREVSA